MITSLSQEVGKSHKRAQIKDFEVAYRQLNQFVDKISEKISNRLQMFQQVYRDDYKEQVSLMTQELKQLRANLDVEILQQKSNEKVYLLEEQRDFFRFQTLKLNEEVNVYLQQNKSLKKKIVDLQVQLANFKKMSLNYEKKIQKLQKQSAYMANLKRQSSVPVLPRRTIKEEILNEPDFNSIESSLIEEKNDPQPSRAKLFERKAGQTVRTKTFSKIQSATKASIRRYEIANQRQQIIDECIKEIKKEIFYRSGQHKNQNVALEQFSSVSFEKFTRTDKKNLIHRVLSNEKLLEDFGQFLATKNGNVVTMASRLMRTKMGDDKYNQKFLNDLKRSFSKKIFELKTNTEAFRNTERKRIWDQRT